MVDIEKAGRASASQELFTEDWKIYRKMVDNDYLFHKGAYSCLEKFLTNAMDRPFDFLDLACGDASMTVQALQNTEVASYEGIDISEQALEIARSTLSRLNCTVELRRADFVEAIHMRTDPVDVVWIGLSLHHLHHDGKVAVAQAIRRLMGRGGCLLVYENTSPDGEGRDAWLRRGDEQETVWTAYTPAEWKYVTAHVHQADFPETTSTWQALGPEAGFSTTRELFVSPTIFFGSTPSFLSRAASVRKHERSSTSPPPDPSKNVAGQVDQSVTFESNPPRRRVVGIVNRVEGLQVRTAEVRQVLVATDIRGVKASTAKVGIAQF